MRALAILIAAVAALALGCPAFAATAAQVGSYSIASGGSHTIALSAPVAAGDAVVVLVAQAVNAGTLPSAGSMTDTAGGTYTCRTVFKTSNTAASANLCYKLGSAAMTTADTISFTTANTASAVAAAVIDAAGINAFDVQAAATSGTSGTTQPSQTVTPSAANGLALAILISNSSVSMTPDAGWSALSNVVQGTALTLYAQWLSPASASLQTWAPTVVTASRSWGADAFSFITASAPTTGCRRTLTTLGIGC